MDRFDHSNPESFVPDPFLEHALQDAGSDFFACCPCFRRCCEPRCCCSSPCQATTCYWAQTLALLVTGILLAYSFVAEEFNTAVKQLTVPIVACAASALPATATFSRDACLSSDFQQCDNDLPAGPSPPFLLEYRQSAGLILFTTWLVVLTLVVALLLVVAEVLVMRRQRLASALLPFYVFFRKDKSRWRSCTTYPLLAIAVVVYVGYAIWRTVSVNFLLFQTSNEVVSFRGQELFQRNSTCTIADGSRIQVAMLLDLNAARRLVGGAGQGSSAQATFASAWSFIRNTLPLFVTLLFPQIQRILALDSDGDALAAVRLQGLVYCAGDEPSAGAATALTGSNSGVVCKGKYHTVVMPADAPPPDSPHAQLKRRKGLAPSADPAAAAAATFTPARFVEVGENLMAGVLWGVLVIESALARESCCCSWLVLRFRYFVWPWPSLQQCSASRPSKKCQCVLDMSCRRCCCKWQCVSDIFCRCSCPTECAGLAADEKHTQEVGILLAAVAAWKEEQAKVGYCPCCRQENNEEQKKILNAAAKALQKNRGESSGEGKEEPEVRTQSPLRGL